MLHLALVYVHLLATCLALGLLIACDLRLLARLRDRTDPAAPVLVPPSRFVVRAVTGALAALLVTGAALVALALQARPDALANPKLQVKIVLVAVLVANAAALHRWTFPRLAGVPAAIARAPAGWRRGVDLAALALPVAVSHALWGYCAFLGIARPWNFVRSFEAVMGTGLAVVALAWMGAVAVLAVVANRPGVPRDGRAARPRTVAVDVGEVAAPRRA